MGDVLRPDRLDETALAERRKNVAGLYLRRVPQSRIAQQLGVSQATISGDLSVLRAEWREEHRADIDQAITREAAELDTIEFDAAQQFAATHEVEWLNARLKVKERRAKLLGLDQPARIDATSGGQPLGNEWVELRGQILAVMELFPEAKLMLAEALDGR